VSHIFAGFLDLIFPPKCIFCRRILVKEEEMVCSHCAQRLPHTDAHRRLEKGMQCLSPLRYEGTVRDSIHRFKFGGRSFYAKAYAPLMAEELRSIPLEQWDILTWVPLSKKRLRERGYDQAFLLARHLGEEFDCRPIPLLRKTKHTRAQSSLDDPKERLSNVKGVYTLLDGVQIEGKKILLVDDVVTTGATLTSCQKVLLEGGAACVTAVTVASAVKEK